MRRRTRWSTSTSRSRRRTVCGTPRSLTTRSVAIRDRRPPARPRRPGRPRRRSGRPRSTLAYSTPIRRPAETSASVIAWLPPTAIAAGSKDSVEREAVDEPLQAGHVVREAAGRRRRRAHEQDLQLGALEEVARELAERHELVHGLEAAVGDVEQLLERVGRAPRRRDAEAVPAERRLPVALVGLEQRRGRSRRRGGEKRAIWSKVRRTFSSERSCRPVAGSTTREAE